VSSAPLPAPRRWSRLWLALVLVLILVLGAITAFLALNSSRTSPLYLTVLQMVQENAAVQSIFGAPIEEGAWLGRRIHVDEASGKAELEFPVVGSRDRAVVRAMARKVGDDWEITYLEVTGQSIFSKLVLTPLLSGPAPDK
jgi:hypothetical protein